jgi:hypothetical protein
MASGQSCRLRGRSVIRSRRGWNMTDHVLFLSDLPVRAVLDGELGPTIRLMLRITDRKRLRQLVLRPVEQAQRGVVLRHEASRPHLDDRCVEDLRGRQTLEP